MTSTVAVPLVGLVLVALLPAPRAHAGRPEQVAAAGAGISRFDTDGDGRLSRAEHAAAARKTFEAMDANHDGKVTAAEMDASLAHVKGRRPSRSMKALNATAADKIKLSDRDHDGVLTLEEHLIAAMGIFEKMDTDKNGFLTSAELAAGHTVALPKVHRR